MVSGSLVGRSGQIGLELGDEGEGGWKAGKIEGFAFGLEGAVDFDSPLWFYKLEDFLDLIPSVYAPEEGEVFLVAHCVRLEMPEIASSDVREILKRMHLRDVDSMVQRMRQAWEMATEDVLRDLGREPYQIRETARYHVVGGKMSIFQP